MARKSYLQVVDSEQVVKFVADKLTKAEAAEVKGLIAIGYKPVRTTAEAMYPKEKRFGKEQVEAYLKELGADELKKFKDMQNEIAVDKNGAAKTTKNGKPRKKGYVGALKKFRAEYEEEFLKWLEA